MEICRACEHNSKNVGRPGPEHCIVCGCVLAAKTKCFSCECPLKKWEAFATQEEWDKIKLTVQNISDDDDSK